VVLDGLLGKEAGAGDVPVALALGDQVHDLDLALGQPVCLAPVTGCGVQGLATAALVGVEQDCGGRRTEDRHPPGSAQHRAEDLLRRVRPMHEVAVRTAGHGGADHFRLVGVGQHQDAGARRHLRCGSHAVHHRHSDVEHHHVGVVLLRKLDSLTAVLGLRDEPDPLV